MTTKPDTKPDGDGEANPWDDFTPDQMMDGVAERMWAKMGEKPDGGGTGDGDGDGDGGDGDGGDGGTGERTPKATGRGQKFSDWFFGGIK